MKKLLYLLPFIILAACKKDDDDDDGGGDPIVFVDVPNWLTVPMVADMTGGRRDTVYAYTSVSGTFIQYKGRPYRIKAHTGLPGYPISDTVFNFYVRVFDGSDQQITDCFVASGRYFRNGMAINRSQTFDPTIVQPFDTGRLTPYYSR